MLLELLPRGGAHHDVQAERRRAGRSIGEAPAEEVDGEGRAVLDLRDLEAGIAKQRLHLVRCREMAGGWRLRPGEGILQSLAASLHDIVAAEQGAGLEHPRHLAIEAGAVLDVHGHVQGEGGVESAVLERHRQGARHPVGDAAGEAGAAGQLLGGGDVLRREVDAGDAAAHSRGEIAGGAADAAAHVEHVVAGLEADFAHGVDGGRASADVKLVDGRQLLGRQAVRVEARCRDCLQDAVREVAGPVMPRNRLLQIVRHRALHCSGEARRK